MNEYPQAIQAFLKDVLENGTILNSTPDKEHARELLIPKERSVVKSPFGRSIWLIQNMHRREIPNMDTFVSLGYDLDNVTVVTEDQLRIIPLGEPYPKVDT